MYGKNVLLKVMWCFESRSNVMSHYPVKFDVNRTCGIRDITFFVCHETTYNHVIKGLRNYANCAWQPSTISQYLLKFVSHEPCKNKDITFFIRHVTIVPTDHEGWWPFLISYNHFNLSKHWPGESWNIESFKDMWYVMWLLIISQHPV